MFSQLSFLRYTGHLWVVITQVGYIKLLATSVCLYAAFKLVYALYLSPLRNIPGPLLARLTDKRAKFFGATGAMARKALEDYEKYGDIYVLEPNSISISNPRDIRAVLGSHEFRKSDLYKALDVLDVQTTISARDTHIASMRRRQIGPYFSNSYLAKMEPAILKHGIEAIKEKWDGLLEESESGQIEVNYHKTTLNATFDVTGSLAFGKEFGSLKNDDLAVSQWIRETLILFSTKCMLPLLKHFPVSLVLARLERTHSAFMHHASSCIAVRRELLAALDSKGEMDKKPVDLLQGFLDCSDPESKTRMSVKEVQAEAVALLIAGSETTGNTLAWTIHLLMLYPECYKRAVHEVRSAFGKDHLVTYSDARAKLPYLEACIHESLRLCAVTGGQVPRVTPKGGVTLSGHFIPGGTEITINVPGANHNKKHWETPRLYDPTRFLNNDEAKRGVFTFSYGVRVCPGKQLAWIEMYTILANMLKDYDLRLPDGYSAYGPTVLDEGGYPKLMDELLFITRAPRNAERDCRLIISTRS